MRLKLALRPRIDLIFAKTRLKCLAVPGIDVFQRDSRQKHNWQALMFSHSLEALDVMGRMVKKCSNYLHHTDLQKVLQRACLPVSGDGNAPAGAMPAAAL